MYATGKHCCQVAAKGLAGLMGRLKLANEIWQHKGEKNGGLLREKWEWIGGNRSVGRCNLNENQE